LILFIAKNRRLPIVNIVILLTMLGGLLMGGWSQANVSFNLNLERDEAAVTRQVTNQSVASRSFLEIFR
jgi:hypothetical protein